MSRDRDQLPRHASDLPPVARQRDASPRAVDRLLYTKTTCSSTWIVVLYGVWTARHSSSCEKQSFCPNRRAADRPRPAEACVGVHELVNWSSERVRTDCGLHRRRATRLFASVNYA